MENFKIPLEEYLKENNINVVGKFENINLNNINNERVFQQIQLIYTFHNVTMKYDGLSSKFIRNKLGKAIEKYKISIKNYKKDIKGLHLSSSVNEFEKMLMDSSDKYLKRAEQCIEVINKSDYIGLIKRSMRRFEISLGNTYFSNLRKGEFLEIGTLKRCSYNMVEMDGVYLINKLKRNGYKIDYEKAIDYFCDTEGLKVGSANFMKALISYPHEYMKCAERYRVNKKNLTINEFKINLNRAMVKDGESVF